MTGWRDGMALLHDGDPNTPVGHARETQQRLNDVERSSMRGAPPSTDGSINGDPINVRLHNKLTSSGNTVTYAASQSNGDVKLYIDPVGPRDKGGWQSYFLRTPVTLDTTGYTSNRKYDIFVVPDISNDDSMLGLGSVIWTDETTRSVALFDQDGAQLLSTDHTWRWIGTGRYNGSTMLVSGSDSLGMTYYGTGNPYDPTGAVYSDPFSGTIQNADGFFDYYNGGLCISLQYLLSKYGSNVASPDTTALTIFNTAQTYNSESMAAGAALFGSNSSSKANMLWNPSNNRLEFRGGTTVQAYVDTNGKIGFGGTSGSLSTAGMGLKSNTYPASALIEWTSTDTNVITGQIVSDYAGAATNTGLRIISQAHDAGVRGYVQLAANDSAGVTRAFANVDSNGTSTFDHTATTGAAGANSLSVKTKTSATNALSTALGLFVDSSGSAAAGLGGALSFNVKNSAGTLVNIGYVAAKYTTVTAGSEASVLSFGVMVAGVLTGKLAIDVDFSTTGNAAVTGTLTVSNRVTASSYLNIPTSGDKTISGGVITITGSRHRVDTEAAAATDDLDTINGGVDGDVLILSSVSSARDTTIKNGTGNIICGADRVLTSAADRIVLQYNGTNWNQFSFSDNA